MLLSLLPLAGWAGGNLTGSSQDNLKGLRFTIIKVYNEVPEGEANTVSVSQNNWDTKADNKTELLIPSTVTFSVNGLDYENKPINKEVTFKVVEIDANGFSNLDDLRTVTIPASIEKIGESAFANDYVLETVQIASNSKLTEIGEYAFSAWINGTFDLSSATSLEALPAQLFFSAFASENSFVKKIVLPESMKDIKTALAKLPNLEEVNIAKTKLVSLAEGALEGNTQITDLELPATCKTIAASALKGTQVHKLTINAYQGIGTQSVNKAYGDGTKDKEVLTNLTVKGEFKGTIAAAAFQGLANLAEVKFDDVSGTIAANAFTDNPNLAKIILGNVKDGANIGAAFAPPAGTDGAAALTIGNIADATIAEGAFKGLKSVEIGDIATKANAIGDDAFAGSKLASITIGKIVDGAKIGASFVPTFSDGATLEIEEIGDANIAPNAFTGLKSVKIGDIATKTIAIGAGAFAGKLTTIETGDIKGKIGASFSSTDGAALKIQSIGENANLAASAFTNVKSLEITEGISNGTFAAGSFVFVDNNVTANLGAISGGTFAADAITGPTGDGKKLTLTIGNVSVALSKNLATGNIKKATIGEISNEVKLDVFGAAEEIEFGAIKEGGSLSLTSDTENTTLTKVTFAAIEVANGITAGTFDKSTKLATVLFNGLLADNAVAAGAFKTAGSGVEMVVTYALDGCELTKPFARGSFGVAGDEVKVTLKTTQKFFENYAGVGGDVKWFYRTEAKFAKATVKKTIKFEGEFADGFKYARFYVADDEKAVFDKEPGVTAYSMYVDGVDFYMNPLRVYGGKYHINGASPIRAAFIVKSKTGDDITVTMNAEEGDYVAAKQSIQNADDKFGILYNDYGSALTGARITMENSPFFKLTDGDAVNWAALQTNATYKDNNAIVLLSNPAKSNYIQFADFDPATQPTIKIADGGYYLLTKKAAPAAARQVIWLDEDGNTTAIESVEVATPEEGEMNNATNNAIYNLQGVRVNGAQKGIYIQNGKKYVVK